MTGIVLPQDCIVSNLFGYLNRHVSSHLINSCSVHLLHLLTTVGNTAYWGISEDGYKSEQRSSLDRLQINEILNVKTIRLKFVDWG